jgi:hypothetical protein
MNGVVLVQTTLNNNTALSFSESDKSTTAPVSLFRNTEAGHSLTLQLENASGQSLDETSIQFNKDARNQFESNDGGKLLNEYSLYSFTADSVMASMNSLPEPTADSKIPMGIYASQIGSFVIRATAFNLPAATTAYLYDHFLDRALPIEGTAFAYAFNVTADAASKGNKRFELRFKAIPQLPMVPIASFAIRLSPNPAKDRVKLSFSNAQQANTTITITNAVGSILQTIDAGYVQQGEINVSTKSFAKGTYYVTLYNGTERKTEKLQVQ